MYVFAKCLARFEREVRAVFLNGRVLDVSESKPADNLVVVELKVSRGHEKTVGQLLRYIGFTKREYAKGRKVRGVIVASELSSGLRLAAEPLKDALDVRLMTYNVKV